MPLELDTLVELPAWTETIPGLEPLAERAAAAALAAAGEDDAVTLCVVFADDATVRGLNSEWRDKDAPTNVLSFATRETGAPLPPEGPEPLGDVILAYETCAREAADQGKALADHVCHLIVHGVLHLVGYDHQHDEDATEMETLETAVLSGLGIADPYADGDPLEHP